MNVIKLQKENSAIRVDKMVGHDLTLNYATYINDNRDAILFHYFLYYLFV